VNPLRALIARLDSWARFPEFEHLDDMPRSVDGEAIDFRNAQAYDQERGL
jgi:hypothetical protein